MCYTNSYIRLVIDVIVNVLLYFQAFLFLEVALPTINRLLRLCNATTYSTYIFSIIRLFRKSRLLLAQESMWCSTHACMMTYTWMMDDLARSFQI